MVNREMWKTRSDPQRVDLGQWQRDRNLPGQFTIRDL